MKREDEIENFSQPAGLRWPWQNVYYIFGMWFVICAVASILIELFFFARSTP